MPNGWRHFIATDMMWLEINPEHWMSILEFFAIYQPVYNKTGVLAFTVQTKFQFILLKQIYSNNKN
jgi:hypothetical protein